MTSKTSNIQTASVEQFNYIQLAWLAAAQIARNYGYSCAATLVECYVKMFHTTNMVRVYFIRTVGE